MSVAVESLADQLRDLALRASTDLAVTREAVDAHVTLLSAVVRAVRQGLGYVASEIPRSESAEEGMGTFRERGLHVAGSPGPVHQDGRIEGQGWWLLDDGSFALVEWFGGRKSLGRTFAHGQLTRVPFERAAQEGLDSVEVVTALAVAFEDAHETSAQRYLSDDMAVRMRSVAALLRPPEQ